MLDSLASTKATNEDENEIDLVSRPFYMTNSY
jgi:hypothetical protein